ncbi:intraflagellar transport protein 25 homolog isoform X2 [Brachyhypopomus gauderio]|uniref:intraflagellar transport protein 25 homolog isoform X2 n=1 Tax=Brachyhypopomus gauderio TaxID=698409 RepID=UPI0040414B76
MINTALNSFGAQVVLATSSDENHPPENIIDGITETFWLSTVKRLRIEKSTLEEADKFEVIAEKEFEHTESSLQTNDISVDGSHATHLRFLILSGYDHFVSVHKVGLQA